MTTISTPLVAGALTGWLIGAAAAGAAPLPSYDVLFDRVSAERAAPAPRPSPAQDRDKVEREREKEREAQRERQEAEREAARERREAQREQWKAQVRAQQDRQRAERERQQRQWVQIDGERVVKTFSVGKTGSLLLHNMSGDVVITAGAGSEIKVEAIKRGKGRSDAEARQQLENVVLTMQDAGGGRVDVRAEPRGRDVRAWIDFNVTVPYETAAEVHSVSGDISVTGVKGEVRAETVSGDVRGSALMRLASAKSVSGDVQLNGVESDGTLSLSAVSGDVTVNGLKARALDVSAVSGDTVLNQCQTERAQVNTVNGDITYGGRLSKSGRYELKTHSGEIMLNHQGSGFEIAASTFSGGINFDEAMPATVKGNVSQHGPGRSVRGTVGGGGAYVELTTFSGDIMVRKGQ
jgi:DUF4097 and DUF4098 domain-containing protein YvlB